MWCYHRLAAHPPVPIPMGLINNLLAYFVFSEERLAANFKGNFAQANWRETLGSGASSRCLRTWWLRCEDCGHCDEYQIWAGRPVRGGEMCVWISASKIQACFLRRAWEHSTLWDGYQHSENCQRRPPLLSNCLSKYPPKVPLKVTNYYSSDHLCYPTAQRKHYL